jgi:amino acid adenylation domain-containing protein
MSSHLQSSSSPLPGVSQFEPRDKRAGAGLVIQTTNTPACENIKSIAELIARHAASNPRALALAGDGWVLNYGELERQSNQAAQCLISRGVAREHIVALCLPRSASAIIWSLAILKAGAAYLPLDPAYPIERLAFMLNDAQPLVLITRQEMAAQLADGNWQTVAVDQNQAEIESQPETLTVSPTAAEDLAYVIYTSGSTGQPKGVEVTHGSLLNLIAWHQREFAVSAADRASHLAGLGFDAAVWEVWPYLTAGASLHLPNDCTRLSADLLRDWLTTNQITISFLPTALAERMLVIEWPTDAALRLLLTGADTLHRYPASRLPFKLINNYGPTECTVVATSGAVEPNNSPDGLPTIGRAIANTEIYILDENLQQVPEGDTGELFIGGAGVARGYLNRPELTAEKFIPSPFSAEPNARLYRTGDRARYLANGEIAYLGRLDDQIKILGHRIEPNEIVAVLDRHPAIQESVVIARNDAYGEKHLVAHIVLKDQAQPATVELRSFLELELPAYMVPAIFVPVEALPLTPNGKIDTAGLPAPNAENTLRDLPFIAPRTPVEERLAETLSSLLALEHISVNDNFFLLGGHSLLGTQLIAQLRGQFGVDLGLRTLFDSPSVAQLALEIERLVQVKIAAMSEDEVACLLA